MITPDQIEGSAWRAWNALKSLYCDLEFFSDIDANERAQLKEEIRSHLEFYADLCERFDTTDALVERSARAMREIEEQKTFGHRGY
ncbi:MAG: hypothetical protein MUO70_04240 [Euryarchaeota archaeon]|jgi:hypothetical protein|nr:hypothetical protein [Euryarchaeota archaeon]